MPFSKPAPGGPWWALLLGLGCVLGPDLAGPGWAANLTLQVTPRFRGEPLVLDQSVHTNASGQVLSVTRLDFLLSDLALRRTDGVWLAPTQWQSFVSVGTGRTNARVSGLPPGVFDRVRFRVGLRPELNHADPAQHPADHPLNPNLNGLHWGWAGGYVFLALEGRWHDGKTLLAEVPAGASGYSFHVGNDPLLMTVERPWPVAGGAEPVVRLVVQVDQLLAGVEFSAVTHSTHSRPGDELALRLKTNAEAAFDVQAAPPAGGNGLPERPRGGAGVRLLSSRATPYRFTFGAQFPRPELPADNPLTEEGVELGRRLFHDPRLSVNGRQSCASCHQAAAAFVDPGRAVSVGAEGQSGTRNAMPLFNLAWKSAFFWDGRARTLREQVLMPIENPVEMHESLANVVAKLRREDAGLPAYPGLFDRAFGSPEIAADRVARALEQFLLAQVSHDSKLDRALQGRAQLTEEERRGFELFVTEYDPRRGRSGADCFHCHGGPFFTHHGFANNGLDGVASDLGRGAVTGRPADAGRFAVPSLRNVALTAPYMHDGRFATLEQVVDHYAGGVKSSPSLDPNLAKHPAGGVPLSPADRRALVAFLRTLTDERYVTPAGP